jgi:hypothetical protein
VVVAAATAGAADAKSTASASKSSSSEWRRLLIDKSLKPGQLVKLTMKAKIKGDPGLVNIKPAAGSTASSPAAAAAAVLDSSSVDKDAMPYKQLTMRPVMLKGKVMLQVSLLTARQVGRIRTLLLLFCFACSTQLPDIARMLAWATAGHHKQQRQRQQLRVL